MFNRDGQAGTFDQKMITHQLEALEPRVLLTTLVGGDIFEYIDSQGQTVRVVVEGDAIIELIGGDINNSVIPSADDPSVALVLGDLPGYIYESDLGRQGSIAGGLGGADGVEPIDTISISDPINGAGGTVSGPNDDITIQALATHPDTGNTWGINLISLTPVGDDTEITVAQFIEFDADTGDGTVRYSKLLIGNIVGTTDAAPPEAVVASAFDIRAGNEDILYFVTQLGGTGGYDILSIDTSDGTLVDPSKKIIGEAAAEDGQGVAGITFDRVGPGANEVELVVAVLGKAVVEGESVDANRIVRYNSAGDFFTLSTAGVDPTVTVRLAGEVVDNITGIAFKGDNSADSDRYLYATTPEGLLLVDLTTGFAQFMGQLLDPDDLRDEPRGENIADLTWDANSVNPFTGDIGVLVGVDTETDELVYIDDRPRFDTADIYAIYVSQTSENAKISIAVVPPFDPEVHSLADPFKGRGMLPYDGSIGSMRVLDIGNEDPLANTIIISAPDGTGGVLIGARTEEVSDDIDEEDLLPIVSATLAESIGVRPAGLDTDPDDDNNLAAGIYVAPSVVEYVASGSDWSDRLLGSNLDRVTSLAVNKFGTVVAVDTDLSDTGGNLVADQLFSINTTTGKGGNIVTINDGGGDLTGTAALAYGFADLSQLSGEADEELYAIIGQRFGVLNTTTGFFTEIDDDLSDVAGSDMPANASIRSMAFAPGGDNLRQTLYVIADPNGTDDTEESDLYEIEYTVNGAGVINAVTAVTKIGATIDANLSAMTFDASGRLLVQDLDNGRFVEMDPDAATITELDESPIGSLRATVGGFAYDLEGDRILVVDNATSLSVLENESGSAESAALMQIKSGSAGQQIASILIGGTVTGQVYFSGSIDTFYAGWIVTGQTGGQSVGTPAIAENFYVEGDIRNLVTTATIGSDNLIIGAGEGEAIRYTSGVDIVVQGRIGQIFGGDSGIMKVNVSNFDAGVSLTAADLAQSEIEYRAEESGFEAADEAGVAFQEFRLFNGTLFHNDTIETAQIVGTLTTGTPGEDDIIRIAGSLDSGSGDEGEEEASSKDAVDFYAVALVAGQTISIRLENNGPFAVELPIGVYDPDGRLIASEFESIDNTLVVTAERPGLYTIGVGQHHESFTLATSDGPITYTLNIEGAGTVSLGGINLAGGLHYGGTDGAIVVDSGDLGAINLGDKLFFDKAEVAQATDIFVNSGNLRAIVAGSIGNGGLFDSSGLNATVSGDIGLIQTTTGDLSLPSTFVGGDIQAIDSFGALMLEVSVNGGIGTIFAGSMPAGADDSAFIDKSFIIVNADNIGQDGIIDLIDVDENFEDVAIITNDGGNVRYIRVGGDIVQDSFFTGGNFGTITGSELSVVDDSGARINLEAAAGGTLELTTYGIRGSGGSVIVKVESDTGLAITSVTGQNNRPAEVSEVVITAEGQGLIIDQDRNTVTVDRDNSVDPVNLAIGGSSPLDIFSIVGNGFNAISNTTGGELVNITAKSIGALYAAGSIGIAKQNNGAAVFARDVIFDTYPFFMQRNAVIAGDFGSVRSDQAIGNVIADAALGDDVETGGTGTIGQIYANADNRDVAGVFEGIAGPIYASGEIYHICIGEGLAHQGSGEMAASGIFAQGEIVKVINQGLGSDIRGIIASSTGIDQIVLTGGGSLINARILTISNLEETIPVLSGSAPGGTYTIFDTSYINKISLTGNGGIIGTDVRTNDLGDVNVKGGFGIINTTFSTLSGGSVRSIYADGFGLRDVYVGDGATIGSITAGQRSDARLSIDAYTASVRASEFDEDSATIYNDLQTALDDHLNSFFNPIDSDYVYTAGVIYDLFTQGSLNLGTISAFRIESAIVSFANSVRSITADENIENLTVTTGTITSVNTGSSRLRGDLINSDFDIAGDIGTFTIYGNVDNTDITANNNGTLNRLLIKKVGTSDANTYGYDDIDDGGVAGDERAFYRQLRDTLTEAGMLMSDLESLAVRGSDGAVFAARYNTATQQDELLQIDPIRGTITVLGALAEANGDVFGTGGGSQISALAFAGNELMVVLTDNDAADGGAASVDQDKAIGRISLTPDTNGNLVISEMTTFPVANQGDVVTAMAINNNRQVFLVINGDTVVELIRDADDLDFNDYARQATFAGTDLVGIGFDDRNTLRAVDANGDEILALDIDNATSTVLGDAPDGLTAYAIGNVGGGFVNGSSLTISGRINTLDIGGDIIDSTVTVLSGSSGRYSINRFTLGGDLFGTLELFDDVSTLSVAGSLGQAGDRLVIHGDLRSLIVGSDRNIMGVEMGLDLVVLGDLGTLTVNGLLSGDVTVQGDLQRLTVTADDTQEGTDILTGQINVTESIRSISVRDGNVSGDVFAGRDLSTFTITNGDFTGTASATSIYGGIRSLSVSGDMDGLVQVDNGDLSTLRVGGDMGATAQVLAQSARSVTVTGQIVGGATIAIDNVISTITAGYIGDGVTAANITAGGIQSLTTRGVRGVNDGDLYASLVLGDSGRAARITAAGNFGGVAMIQGDVSLSVRGDVDMDVTAGEYLMVNGDVSSLRVTGDLSGGIFVQGDGGNWTANSITNAIITTGFDLRGLTVREAVTDSLIQVGLWAGNDMVFASVDGQQDLGEQSRRATLGRFTANSVDNSVIAAGGDLTTVSVREDVTDSSFSAGWSVGSLAINERMGGELDGDVLREQDGRALFNGSMRTFTAGDITDSYITAGVDAGVGGDFSAPTVIYDNATRAIVDGGGMSELGSIRGTTNAGTRLLADSGITRDSTTGAATINGNVTYALADLEQGNALPASVGVATQGNPLSYIDNGATVTITVRGDGSVDVRDASALDGVLDGLVITGTTSRTTITIETSVPGAVDIARIFTGDDTELSSFSFDGNIVGDDTAGLDVWFDGGMRTLDLAGFGNAASPERMTGAIGGDVSTFNLDAQAAGTLRISGAVRTMTVDAGSGDPLQIAQQTYAGRSFSTLTFDGANVYGVDGDTVYTIDPLNNALIAGQQVTDITQGNVLNIVGMDIENATGDVFAVAELYNQNPTVQISAVASDLQGLAVRPSDGTVFAVRYDAADNVDQLVTIDVATGGQTVVGTLQDIFGNSYGSNAGSQVMTLAFRNDVLLAIMTDRDAADGGAYPAGDDVTIAAIATTANAQGFVRVTGPSGNQALPPVELDVNGGEVYTGMATNAAGDVFVIRDDNEIVEIDLSNGEDIGAASTFAGVTLTGIGFDINDNLIGLDTTSNQLYELDLVAETATALSTTTLAPGLTAFAIGKTDVDGGYVTYAYDDIDDGGVAGDERAFYTNAGLTSTLGIVDPATGEFTQLAPLAQDEDGNALEGTVVAVAVDTANTRIKVLTDQGKLVTYNNDGTLDLVTDIVELTDSNGDLVTSIAKIDYSADGRLLGVDSLGKQLVAIDTATGLVSALTEPGSVLGDIGGFGIDEVTGAGLIFNNDNAQVSLASGFSQESLGGISADSISRLTLGDGYAGRIATQGNLDMPTINGDFDGILSAGGDIRSVTVSGGQYTGTVYAGGDVSRATLRDADFASSGLLWTDGKLSFTVTGGRDFDGLLNGKIVAGSLTSLTTRGDFASNATIIANNDAATISLGGDFGGMMDLAQISRSLTITGQLLSGASIVSDGDATTINLRGGAQANTLIAVEGAVRSLTVGETFAGVVGVENGIQRASFIDLSGALVSAGLDTQLVSVRGDMINSVISLGTWFGADHTYNTLDDVITGGEVRSVTISGDYRGSMTAVGVLPSFNLGGFVPGVDSNLAFLSSSAEAGGLVPSVLGSFSVRGEIANNGRIPGVVSADEIGRVSTGQTGSILRQMTFADPYGPVQIISQEQTTNSRFEIILSEPVLASSVIISVDRDGDNTILPNTGDVQGSIFVRDGNGDAVNNITLTASTRTIDGVVRGVITGVSATPMAGNVGDITILYRIGITDQQSFEENPILMDRSGLRSALRGFNGDPLGTLYDADNDGFEG